jgi:hypothetical protein
MIKFIYIYEGNTLQKSSGPTLVFGWISVASGINKLFSIMRKRYLLIITILSFSCQQKRVDPQSISKDPNNDSVNTEHEFLYKKNGYKIELEVTDFNYLIKTNFDGIETVYDLRKMHIPTKTPNKLTWANNDYACMMVWWSQSQSRHIFVPTNPRNKFIYLDKDIEASDSINNNIVYIDSVYYEKDYVKFKVENLLTKKSKILELKYGEKNGSYPFYDSISLTKNKLEIFSQKENRKINISSINSGT